MTTRATRIRVNGQTYDSLLELAWQRQLDDWGVRNAHHFEHVELPGRGWWEPDFTLWDDAGEKYWLEVKGAHGERTWKVEVAAAERPGRVIVGVGRLTASPDDCWDWPEYLELPRDYYDLAWYVQGGYDDSQLAEWDGRAEQWRAASAASLGSWAKLLGENAVGDFRLYNVNDLRRSGTVVG